MAEGPPPTLSRRGHHAHILVLGKQEAVNHSVRDHYIRKRRTYEFISREDPGRGNVYTADGNSPDCRKSLDLHELEMMAEVI